MACERQRLNEEYADTFVPDGRMAGIPIDALTPDIVRAVVRFRSKSIYLRVNCVSPRTRIAVKE